MIDSFFFSGTQKKRARIDGAVDLTSKEQKLTSSFCPGGPVSFVCSVDSTGGNYLRQCGKPWEKKCVCMNSCEETMQTRSLEPPIGKELYLGSASV